MFSLCGSIIGTFDVGNAERRKFRNEIFVEENWNPDVVSFFFTLLVGYPVYACQRARVRERDRYAAEIENERPGNRIGRQHIN